MARILVVDDHRAVAEALAERFCTEPDVDAVEVATHLDEARRALRDAPFDLVVVDLDLNGQDGLVLVTTIRADYPTISVMVIGEPDDSAAASAAIRLGVRGYATPTMSTAELMNQLRGLLRGESHLPARLLSAVLANLTDRSQRSEEETRIDRLTPRELEVLTHMVAGLDRAGIAASLGLSINTVRTHAKNLLAKLEVHSTIEAVNLAIRARLAPAIVVPRPDPAAARAL